MVDHREAPDDKHRHIVIWANRIEVQRKSRANSLRLAIILGSIQIWIESDSNCRLLGSSDLQDLRIVNIFGLWQMLEIDFNFWNP